MSTNHDCICLMDQMFLCFLLFLVNFTPAKNFNKFGQFGLLWGWFGGVAGGRAKDLFTKLFLYGYQELHAQNFFI